MIPWWMWGAFYALAGAASGAWFLREWSRNETLQDRVAMLGDILVPIFGPQFSRGLVVASNIIAWPLLAIAILIFDVPGHGRNVDKPGE